MTIVGLQCKLRPINAWRNTPDTLEVHNCSPYILDRIVHFWLFKILEIRKTKKLEHNRWIPERREDIDVTGSMTTVGALIEFHDTVAFHQDELARRASLAKLRSHLLSPHVTDEEIFEGLGYAYKRYAAGDKNSSAKLLKRIFLSSLIRNRADLTTGTNKQHFNSLVSLYSDLATDFSRGIFYYYQVYSH